jgi:hypothetical protein
MWGRSWTLIRRAPPAEEKQSLRSGGAASRGEDEGVAGCRRGAGGGLGEVGPGERGEVELVNVVEVACEPPGTDDV